MAITPDQVAQWLFRAADAQADDDAYLSIGPYVTDDRVIGVAAVAGTTDDFQVYVSDTSVFEVHVTRREG